MLLRCNLSVLVVVVFSIVVAHSAVRAETEEQGGATADGSSLTTATFSDTVGGKRSAFVAFVAPWCGHCKALKPEWSELADSLAKHEDRIVLATVNGEEQSELAEAHSVEGFPTLLFFPAGSTKGEVYSGDRNVKSLLEFVNSKTALSVKYRAPRDPVKSVTGSELDALIQDPSKHVLVQFYAPWCGHCKRLEPTYKQVAKSFLSEDSVAVVRVDADQHRATALKHGVNGYPTLIWFSQGDTEGEVYGDLRTPAAMVAFINKKAGTDRVVGGLSFTAGRIKALDNVARKFRKARDAKRQEILKQVKEAVKTGKHGIGGHVNEQYAKYYVEAMEAPSKAKDEIVRLERLIASVDITPKAADELRKKANIFRLVV